MNGTVKSVFRIIAGVILIVFGLICLSGIVAIDINYISVNWNVNDVVALTLAILSIIGTIFISLVSISISLGGAYLILLGGDTIELH